MPQQLPTAPEDVEYWLEGRTFTRMVAEMAATGADATGSDAWRTVSWGALARRARHVGAAMIAAGVRPGDHVAVMVGDRIEHVLADLGALHAGATPVAVHQRFSPEQVAHVAALSEPAVLVVETTEQLRRWATALSRVAIRTIIVLDTDRTSDERVRSWDDFVAAGAAYDAAHPIALDLRAAALSPGTTATALYTAGITGDRTGVAMSYRNVATTYSDVMDRLYA